MDAPCSSRLNNFCESASSRTRLGNTMRFALLDEQQPSIPGTPTPDVSYAEHNEQNASSQRRGSKRIFLHLLQLPGAVRARLEDRRCAFLSTAHREWSFPQVVAGAKARFRSSSRAKGLNRNTQHGSGPWTIGERFAVAQGGCRS